MATDHAAVAGVGQRRRSRPSLRRVPKRALFGGALLLGLLGTCLVVQLFSSADPYQQDLANALASPSWSHPLGTDELGRDTLARIAHGANYTVGITVAATVVASIAGVSLGVVAGYYRGWLDTVIMRLVDAMLSFPGILVAFIVIAILGAGTLQLLYAAALYSTPIFARLAYGTSRSVMTQQYIDSARARGASNPRIILRHVLPNITSEMTILFTLRLAVCALLVSALSFLGLGVAPPTPEWGAMLSNGRQYLRTEPLMVVIPGLTITLLIVGFNLLGDGLRDLLDPRRKR